jgi:hypothetical protein
MRFQMSDREERVARNELAFRQANETLRGVFESAVEDEAAETFPFLCECGERECMEVVPLSLETYACVRAEPTHFVILAGHKQLESERIVAAGEGWEVVEKSGVAGEIARDGWVSA